jgi:type VI secretion system protein VasG
MLITEPRHVLRKLSRTCTRAFDAAAGKCVAARHYEVTVEHAVLALLEDEESDFCLALTALQVDLETARESLRRYLGDLRKGNPGKPVLSPLLAEWVQDAWIYASTELSETSVRSGALLVRLVQAPGRYLPLDVPGFDAIPRDQLRKDLPVLVSAGKEGAEAAAAQGGGKPGAQEPAADGALARYTTDLTARARAGELDPVLGREREVRQIVEILVRRRKNNPIIVGEAGVGKTALVEGLALRIAEKSVPKQLENVRVCSLDLGALQAGASMKGEFENRLKGVISEVKASPVPIVLFIDEAHTLIGAGGGPGSGGGDAANLLKPALARGELRTIAATTYAEFKKYFEKDAALERRFQPVRVDEPSIEVGTLMLRGLAKSFEEAHGVVIRDEAVVAAVKLSSRYISGRQLPDKAVDLLDTAAAYVKLVRAAPPAEVEDVHADLAAVEREIAAYERDEKAGVSAGPAAKHDAIARRDALKELATSLDTRVAEQRAIVEEIDGLRKRRADAKDEAEGEKALAELRVALDKLRAIPPEDLLVTADVDESAVSAIVADWTGIPVKKMVKDDVAAIVSLEDRLRKRVRGQDDGLATIAREMRAARSGLKPEHTPLGVFLLVGPSGVGKTETALCLAETLFGGERFMVTINMSEFQERHTVSRLIGSPPGYVGFGEGGVLTEAVRHRPYSVVLLDEVEKADREVMNLFYQVFDKGTLSDGEGRAVDFRNTVVILTSNLATDLLTTAAPPGETPPPFDDLITLVKPTLSSYFKPALLARMTVVPYLPIGTEALKSIVRLKLDGVVRRAKASHGLHLKIDDAIIEAIADRCHEVESGARNIDHILRGVVLPLLSGEILRRIAEGEALDELTLSVGANGEFQISQPGAASS